MNVESNLGLKITNMVPYYKTLSFAKNKTNHLIKVNCNCCNNNKYNNGTCLIFFLCIKYLYAYCHNCLVPSRIKFHDVNIFYRTKKNIIKSGDENFQSLGAVRGYKKGRKPLS